MTDVTDRTRFPAAFEVELPPDAAGWQDMFPAVLPFSQARRAYEDSVFWFRETIHWPRPLRPFEANVLQYGLASLAQFSHRHYVTPGAKGFDFRVLCGHVYISPGAIDDPDEIVARAAHFRARGGFYYDHWDELYAGWMDRIRALLARMEAISFTGLLPEMVPIEQVVSGRGLGPVHDAPRRLHDLLDAAVELWQQHFEFLNLGYGAYLDYFAFCREVFPDVSDLEIATTVAGIDVDLFRPDRELRRLARAAVDSAVADALCEGGLAAVAEIPGGEAWLDDFERTKHPWFNYSTGSGFYHDDRVWADDLDIPLGFICAYVEQIRAGVDLDAGCTALSAGRDRLVAEWRRRLEADAARTEEFEAKLRLARTVAHFVENHNFYIEHWGMSVVWRRMRELSALFVGAGFWPRADDIFYLRADEIESALWDVLASWATATPALGPQRWPQEVARRRRILDACATATLPPALGVPPTVVDEPFTAMLWGVTAESIQSWLAAAVHEPYELTGLAASPGRVRGRARVVTDVDALDLVEEGEILVTENTLPSWTPVFTRIAATVTEVGGMMSHAAIVCREYGLPAVTGVAQATQRIRTGQIIEVDGGSGRVSIVG